MCRLADVVKDCKHAVVRNGEDDHVALQGGLAIAGAGNLRVMAVRIEFVGLGACARLIARADDHFHACAAESPGQRSTLLASAADDGNFHEDSSFIR